MYTLAREDPYYVLWRLTGKLTFHSQKSEFAVRRGCVVHCIIVCPQSTTQYSVSLCVLKSEFCVFLLQPFPCSDKETNRRKERLVLAHRGASPQWWTWHHEAVKLTSLCPGSGVSMAVLLSLVFYCVWAPLLGDADAHQTWLLNQSLLKMPSQTYLEGSLPNLFLIPVSLVIKINPSQGVSVIPFYSDIIYVRHA